MNRKTITKEFGNIYGEGKPLHYTTNKSINNLLKEIPNKNFENNTNTNVTENVEVYESEVPYGLIFFVLFIIILAGSLYYFKDTILNFMKPKAEPKIDISNNITNQKVDDANKKVDDANKKVDDANKKVDDLVIKYQQSIIDTKEKKENDTQSKIQQGGVQQLSNKIDTISSYKQEQLVKENSYCYIGTDNGQRECTNAFEGDVCMSGQIFPKMEICVNPRLRV